MEEDVYTVLQTRTGSPKFASGNTTTSIRNLLLHFWDEESLNKKDFFGSFKHRYWPNSSANDLSWNISHYNPCPHRRGVTRAIVNVFLLKVMFYSVGTRMETMTASY